jgi:hypothetical protein
MFEVGPREKGAALVRVDLRSNHQLLLGCPFEQDGQCRSRHLKEIGTTASTQIARKGDKGDLIRLLFVTEKESAALLGPRAVEPDLVEQELYGVYGEREPAHPDRP